MLAAAQRGMIPRSPRAGIVAYLGLTFTLAWIPALLLRGAWSAAPDAIATKHFVASAIYLFTMGWQPPLAVWIVRRWVDTGSLFDHGWKPAARRFVLLGSVAPLALTGAAIAVAWLAAAVGLPMVGASAVSAEPGSLAPALRLALALTVMFALTMILIGFQAFGEEIGWRGYFLPRLMQEIGPWRGLVFHGLAWGLWYAPVFLLSSGEILGASLRSLGFMLTCVLLGTLLGWLRLASKSIGPTVTANTVLTAAAGLPFLLQGMDVGVRGAVYQAPGWVPMLIVLAALLLSRWRDVVATAAKPAMMSGDAAWRWVQGEGARRRARRRASRTLH
jgi:membrane protease YdiL (CAAX protease family)